MPTINAPLKFHSEENPTITYSLDIDFKSIEAGIFNSEGSQSYVPYRRIDHTKTSYTFELTDAEINNLVRALGSNRVLPVRFYIRGTKSSGGYVLFHDTAQFYIDIPKITASVEDTNELTLSLTKDKYLLIKYHSDAKATMSVEARKGATIDENFYIIRNGNETAYTTEHTFHNVENNVFVFSAEDDRGGIREATLLPEMIEYIRPTCYIANNRPDGLGNMTVACTGSFYNGYLGDTFNTLTVQYRYGISGGSLSGWYDMNVTKNGNSYYASADFVIPNFDQQLYYYFEVRAFDLLEEATNETGAIKSIPIFHWGENDFVFEVPVTFNAGMNGDVAENPTFDGDKTITGNLRLKGSGNYGNTLLFGDGTYCYISEPEDDVMHIKAKRIDLNANGVYVYGKPIPDIESGFWQPALNLSSFSYWAASGWYSKLGQTVTVGFWVKGSCPSGYDNMDVAVTGLPFTPMYSAAGGGMCSGAYVSANCNFQCFVAETSGNITTRVQQCNNTANANLSTSSSGCKYRSGGGEMTISGTITFQSST